MRKQKTRRRKRSQKGGTLNVNLQINPTRNIYTKNQFETSGIPVVKWTDTSPYYTLLCVDPDSSEPAWLHWLVVNCRGEDPSTGTTLTPWEPPTPPSSTHRYFFNLYKHSVALAIDAPASRSAFDTEKFVSENGLKLVDQFMFRVKA
jgi:phosphatidylethanolamine-binding protein (PEBP) family uncharacterized protein